MNMCHLVDGAGVGIYFPVLCRNDEIPRYVMLNKCWDFVRLCTQPKATTIENVGNGSCCCFMLKFMDTHH